MLGHRLFETMENFALHAGKVIDIGQKPIYSKLAKIGREDDCFGDEAVREVFERRLVRHMVAEKKPDRLRCELNKIRNADDTVSCIGNYLVPLRILNDVSRPLVMLVSVELHDKTMTLTPIIGPKASFQSGNLRVCNDVGIESLAQEAAKGTLVKIWRIGFIYLFGIARQAPVPYLNPGILR